MKKVILLFISAFMSVMAMAENGVSLQLAKYRAGAVSNVVYKLRFNIPSSLSHPVVGTESIAFDYNGNEDLLLDFTGRLLRIHGGAWAEVNGKQIKAIGVKDEHITLPKGLLRKGKNTVRLAFVSSDASLNRHADYMYTLFVPANARSCFPCFDQPDLKARFALELKVPEGWTAMWDAHEDSTKSNLTQPLPTYLFSFVAGMFQRKTAVRDGRTITALYRETDPQKVAQLDKVFDEAAYSIKWMENYTGIKYPFDSYGFVVLPGYQFGGMEHPGAIQFTDTEIFLGQHPTPDEELTRLELIAHETAHLWFGDLVTMKWFDDVWTKEVFANFLANKVSREVYPKINHDLNFLKSYQRPAIAVDRTDGTHPIQQPLENLKDAGLLYGNIIYDKAPVMMKKLEQQMKPQLFRKGLQAYLHKYAYDNATWDDLINILDSVAPKARLKQFSDVWVKQKGLPTITYNSTKNLTVRQSDPFGRGLKWPQRFTFAIDYGDRIDYKTVNMDKEMITIPLPVSTKGKPHVYPNVNGQGYGRFVINDDDMDANIHNFVYGQRETETEAYSTLLNLNENYLMGRLSGRKFFDALCYGLEQCTNPLIGSTIVGCIGTVRYYAQDSLRNVYEQRSLKYAMTHKLRPVRQQLLRSLSISATDSAVIDTLYNIWRHQKDTTVLAKGMFTNRDYTWLAYHLAIAMPDDADEILSTQRTMLRTEDERREFDYVSRGCTADTTTQKQLFYSLIPKGGREVEPWARQLLSLLCDHSREPLCNSYIKPGLDNLLQIQQSSDIFFPGYWLSALLTGQHSATAKDIVKTWIASHPDFPTSLMNKLKQSVYGMFCTPQP